MGRGDAKDAVVHALIKALDDQNVDVRKSAAEALGKIGRDAKDAVPALIKALDEENVGVRLSVVEALGNIGRDAKDAVPPLINTLSDKDMSVSCEAAEALGKIGRDAKDAVPVLIKVLGERGPEARRGAVYALGQVGAVTPDVVPALRRALSDLSEKVQTRAAIALAKIGRDAEEAILDLMERLNYPHMREAAAIAICMIDFERFKECEGSIQEVANRPEVYQGFFLGTDRDKIDYLDERSIAIKLIEKAKLQKMLTAQKPALSQDKLVFNMIRHGWLDGVERFLDALEKEIGEEEIKAVVHSKVDDGGWSMLHVACMSKDVELIKLLSEYSEPGLEGPNGVTPIHIAATVSSVVIDALGDDLKEPASKRALDAAGNHKYPAIYFAVLSQNLECVEKLSRCSDTDALRQAYGCALHLKNKEIQKHLKKKLKDKVEGIEAEGEVPAYFTELLRDAVQKKKYLSAQERGEIVSIKSNDSNSDNASLQTSVTIASETVESEVMHKEKSRVARILDGLEIRLLEGSWKESMIKSLGFFATEVSEGKTGGEKQWMTSMVNSFVKLVEQKQEKPLDAAAGKKLSEVLKMVRALHKWKEEEIRSKELEEQGWHECKGMEIFSISIKRHLMRMYDAQVEAVYGPGGLDNLSSEIVAGDALGEKGVEDFCLEIARNMPPGVGVVLEVAVKSAVGYIEENNIKDVKKIAQIFGMCGKGLLSCIAEEAANEFEAIVGSEQWSGIYRKGSNDDVVQPRKIYALGGSVAEEIVGVISNRENKEFWKEDGRSIEQKILDAVYRNCGGELGVEHRKTEDFSSALAGVGKKIKKVLFKDTAEIFEDGKARCKRSIVHNRGVVLVPEAVWNERGVTVRKMLDMASYLLLSGERAQDIEAGQLKYGVRFTLEPSGFRSLLSSTAQREVVVSEYMHINGLEVHPLDTVLRDIVAKGPSGSLRL